MSKPEDQSPQQQIDQLLFGGLAGVSMAVILILVEKKPELDNAIGVSLLCFAVALPVLVSSFLMEVKAPGREKRAGRRSFELSGVLLSLVGILLLFFSLHIVAGCAFVASLVLCVAVVIGSWR
jgi:hypothetical protein